MPVDLVLAEHQFLLDALHDDLFVDDRVESRVDFVLHVFEDEREAAFNGVAELLEQAGVGEVGDPLHAPFGFTLPHALEPGARLVLRVDDEWEALGLLDDYSVLFRQLVVRQSL